MDYANHSRAIMQYKCPLCTERIPFISFFNSTLSGQLEIFLHHIAGDFVHHLKAFTSLLLVGEDADESAVASSSVAQNEQ